VRPGHRWKSEHIDLFKAKRLDKGDRVRALSWKQSELWPELLETPALSNRITSRSLADRRHGGIPVIHVQIMLIEDQRDAGRVAKAAIGETDAFCFHKLGGGCLVGMLVMIMLPVV